MIFNTRLLYFWGLAKSKTRLLHCAPTFHVPGPRVWWCHHHGDSWKAQHTACHPCRGSLGHLSVCLSLSYLWAQACSTSAMVFGASRDRIRGPPLSWITTSSSILTPRPRKRFGTWSFSSQIYNPVTTEGKRRKHYESRKAWNIN